MRIGSTRPDWDAHPQSWTALPPASQTLLWSLRHLLVCWPGCDSVSATLIDGLAGRATEAETLLRCLLIGLSQRAHRRIRFGDPACGKVLPDEALILDAIGLDGAEPAPDLLNAVTGCPKASDLAPLLSELAQVFSSCAARTRALPM